MFVLNTVCDDASFLATVLFFRKIVTIISIIVPIILVLLITIDIAKAVMASDDNQIKTVQKLALKRIIWGLVIFFVPLSVNAVFSLFDGKEVAGISCYNNATDEVVDALVQAEKESLLKYEEDTKKLIEAAKQSKQDADQELNELRQKSATNNNSGSTNINSNTATAERIASIAESWSWPSGTNSSKFKTNTGGPYSSDFANAYKKFWHPSRSTALNQRVGACCCHYVKTVVKKAIGEDRWGSSNRGLLYRPDDAYKRRLAKMGFSVFKFDGNQSSLKRGDMGLYSNKSGGGHIYIYLGNNLVSEASNSHPGQYAHISKWTSGNKNKTNNKNWYYIIRAVS